MAEAIGGFYDTPHGVANSVFLPLVTEFNVPSDRQDLSIPKFSGLMGVRESDFGTLAKLAAANVSADNNARVAGEAEYLELFNKAWEE